MSYTLLQMVTVLNNAYNIWAASWENLCMPYANNKGADKPAHPRSLRTRAVWSAHLLFAAWLV